MFDPTVVGTKKDKKFLVTIFRLIFLGYFAVLFWLYFNKPLPDSTLDFAWIIYLMVLYGIAEYLYVFFKRKQIDLTFAWPLLFAVYVISMVALVAGGQEQYPLMNRVEHVASFILITYVVWVFFLKYLPHAVWSKHPYYTALLVLAVTSMAGVWNEHVELFSDTFFGTHLIGDRIDTSLDILMNTLGSVLLLAYELFTFVTPSKHK